MRSWILVIALATFAAGGWVGCERRGAVGHPDDSHEAPRGARPIAAGPPRRSEQQQSLTGAMMSIIRHTRFEGREMPDDVHFSTLEDAARRIETLAHHDPSNLALQSVRRRAVIEIAMQAKDPERRRALEALKAPPAVYKVLASAARRADAAGDSRSCQPAQTADIDTALATSLSEAMPPPIPGCATTILGDSVQLNWTTGTIQSKPKTELDSQLRVANRSAATIGKDLDPQQWDGCSHFFCPDGTYITTADPDTPGQYEIDPSTGLPKKDPAPPTPGTDYAPATLFESFRCHGTGAGGVACNTWFTNLLWIDPSIQKNGDYRVDYHLHTRLHNQVPGFSDVDFQNKWGDAGYLSATAAGTSGNTDVELYKRVVFREGTITLATYNLYSLQKATRLLESDLLVCCSAIPATQRCK